MGKFDKELFFKNKIKEVLGIEVGNSWIKNFIKDRKRVKTLSEIINKIEYNNHVNMERKRS